MDDAGVELAMRWIALLLAIVFFIVSAVKWSRWLAVGMFGVILMNSGFIWEKYGVDSFPIEMISLIPVGIGAYMFIKEQKSQRPSVER